MQDLFSDWSLHYTNFLDSDSRLNQSNDPDACSQRLRNRFTQYELVLLVDRYSLNELSYYHQLLVSCSIYCLCFGDRKLSCTLARQSKCRALGSPWCLESILGKASRYNSLYWWLAGQQYARLLKVERFFLQQMSDKLLRCAHFFLCGQQLSNGFIILVSNDCNWWLSS